MKKTLLTIGVLLSTIAYSNVEDAMNVRARVLDTLTIRIDDHVNFGNVAKGTSYNKQGKYSIKGSQGELIHVGLTGVSDNGELELKGVDGINSIIAIVDNHSEYTMRLESDNYVSAEPLSISLDIPTNTKSQEYVGNIFIKARYQ